MKYRFIYFSFALVSFIFIWSADAAMAQSLTPQQGMNVFTGKDASVVIAEAIIKQGVGSDIKVSINEAHEEDAFVQSSGIIQAETDKLEVDKEHSRWQALLLLKENDRNLAPIRLSGHYDEMTSIPVLKHVVQSGEIISEQDIDWSKESAAHIRKNTVTDLRDLIGKSPKHMISQNRAIHFEEIASPALIHKGTQITLLYKSHNIEIKTFGEAMEPGAKGEVIKVRNITSKAVIQGVVESADIVRVSSPENDSAEALQ